MGNLQTLNLFMNNLKSFPKTLTVLENLERLYLNYNNIKNIVKTISKFKKIQFLDLSTNNITSIPKEISKLKNLQAIDLSNNNITTIPIEILTLDLKIYNTSRQENEYNDGIYIQNNPIAKELATITHDKAKLAAFLSQSGKKRTQNEIKVVLIGAGGAGKTSIVKRLFGEEFDKNESQTHGIIIKSKNEKINNKNIQMNFWDFGGQQIMHAAHQFFLSKDTLYILTVSAREGDTKMSDIMVKRFLKQIKTFGGDSHILIAITKTDENPSFDLNRKDLQKEYPNIKGFIKVSSSENTGIDDLVREINKCTKTMDCITREWGEDWFHVKEYLEKAKDNHIQYQQFTQICVNNNILDSTAQETLLLYLNNIGVVTRFTKFELSDTSVLKPRWVTNAIYRILNSRKLDENNGLLKKNEIGAILHSDDECKDLKERDKLLHNIKYTHTEQQYIIDLMKEFDLCYERDKDTLLVPALLSKNEPDFVFDEKNSLKIVLAYDYLPSSVIPNFIIKVKHLINDNNMWRTGVIIEDADKRWKALIREKELEEKVYIYIDGIFKRDAIPVILNMFREINKTFEKISVKTQLEVKNTGYFENYDSINNLIEMGKSTIVIPELKQEYELVEILGEYIKVSENNIREERIKMGDTFNINAQDGSKIVVAKDNAQVVQVHNDNRNTNMENIIRLFLEELNKSDISEPQKQEIKETVEALKEESKKPIPKKGVIKSLTDGLKKTTTLLGSTQGMGEAATKLMEFFENLYT